MFYSEFVAGGSMMMHPNDLECLYELRQAEIEQDYQRRERLRQVTPVAAPGMRAYLAAGLIALACWLAPAVREQLAVRAV